MSLSRSVFDALLDRDLLGFLLSSKHLRKFMFHHELDASDKVMAMAKSVCADTIEFQEFHQMMLVMYRGVFIAECKYSLTESLMLDLDQKFLALTDATDFSDINHEQHARVDMAWRYRRMCSKSQ